jgi:RNA polymerase sigma-70 factor (ECF subfamily)
MLQTVMTTPSPLSPAVRLAPSDVIGAHAVELLPVVRAVVACVLGEGRSHPDVEDCAHDVLRRAMEGQERLRPGQPVRPWVLGIARHVAIDHLRERARARSRMAWEPAPDSDGSARPLAVDLVADASPPVDDQVDRRHREERVRAAIEQLAEGQRNAMLLFHVEGLGYQQVADRLGVPLGTVATWISRGRRAIAAALQNEVRNS